MAAPERYRLFRPTDLLLALVLVPLVLCLRSPSAGEGGSAAIHLPDGSRISVDLTRDTTLTVEGSLGVLEIAVEGGRIRIASSPCPGQDCVRCGAIDLPGETTACLPSGVFVTIEGEPAEGSPDTFSY